MPDSLNLKVEESDANARLDVFIAGRMSQVSRSRARQLIENASAVVNGFPRKVSYPVQSGDIVQVQIPEPIPAAPIAQDIALEIIYEDEHLVVINKPAGMVVHPGAGVPDGTLVNALLGRLDSVSVIGGVMRPGIVHRLDKDTSGLMIVAKNDVAHAALSRSLASRDIKRVYWAIALRNLPNDSGVINLPIGRHPTVRTKMAVLENGGREAKTMWRVIERFPGFSLIECRLATGRTHQIRVHLAHEKHPILGDSLYGGSPAVALQLASPKSDDIRNALRLASRQMLHARELGFRHPITGSDLHFTAEPPEDFQIMLKALRKEATKS